MGQNQLHDSSNYKPPEPMEIKEYFTCKLCGSHRIDLVETNVTQYTRVYEVVIENRTGLEPWEFGETDYFGGEMSHYQCADCGERIAGSNEELMKVLLDGKQEQNDDQV